MGGYIDDRFGDQGTWWRTGFTESLHPRAPVGSSGGGQFVSANAGKGEAGGQGASEQKQRQVAAVQKLLGRPETGAFTPDDAAAVKKWQTDHGLQVDGVVGTQTLASLLGDDSRKPGALSADDQKKLDGLAAAEKLSAKPAASASAKPGARQPAHKTAPKKKGAATTSGSTQGSVQGSAQGSAKVSAKTALGSATVSASGKATAKASTTSKPMRADEMTAEEAARAAGHGNPQIAQLGREYWLKHIPWGSAGATKACHAQLMAHANFTDQQAWGYCAERHHEATGRWPGQKKGAGGKKGRRDELTPAQSRGAVEIGDDVDGMVPAERAALAGQPEVREVPFELESSGDGLNFSGYAAVFGSPTTIRDSLGEFREQIAPGAFRDSLATKTPVLMFNHGKHPLIGDMPLGRITRASEDDHGLYIEARLTDNWLIQPVRDAVRDGAVSGMSFRFQVPAGGDAWSQDGTQREIRAATVSELGPVVFPAYPITTASVRSALDCVADEPTDLTGRPGTRGAGGGDSREAGQGAARSTSAALKRDRILRMEGLIRG